VIASPADPPTNRGVVQCSARASLIHFRNLRHHRADCAWQALAGAKADRFAFGHFAEGARQIGLQLGELTEDLGHPME
jgi:hypothetical protein